MTRTLSAADLVAILGEVADALEAEKARLCELDGAIGDGDHGVTMALGFSAVRKALAAQAPGDPSAVLNAVAKSFLSAVGASAGPLYATGFLRAAAAVRGKDALGAAEINRMVAAMATGIAERGKAGVGEKTMMDAWAPAGRAAETALQSGADLAASLQAIAAAAETGAESTRDLVALKGRASRLGERAVGHVDPGAVSAALILRTMARSVAARR